MTEIAGSVSAQQENPVKQEHSDIVTSFCRICLRNVSPLNLRLITVDHKTKLVAALKQKVRRKDPHRHICINCSNLLDIVLDFRSTAIKANLLLSAGRGALENDDWDRPDAVNAIDCSKRTVQMHSKQIDSVYEEHLKQEESNQSHIPEQVELVQPPGHDIKLEPTELIEERAISCDREDAEEIFVETPAAVKEENEEERIEGEGADNNEEFVPSCSEDDVPLKKRKKNAKSAAAPSPGRRRGRKPKDHPEFMPQLCDFCGKRVCGESAEGHKNQHLGIKPYPCPVASCNLSFYGRYNRLRHVKRMHSETGVEVHACHVCGKSIRGPIRALKYHLERHEQNQKNEKNFVCQVCGKGFTLQRYLAQHSIIHSGEFPHKCSYCGKKFNNKWGMRTHEKNIHEKRNHASLAQSLPEGESNSTAYANTLEEAE